jgi:hypothetical protein
MTAPTLLSPNTGNYQIGKGKVYFKPEDEPDYIHLGNITEMEFTPSLDTLDHFSSMEGTKKKDASVVIEQSGALRIVMEEFTARNLSLMLMGGYDPMAAGGPRVEIFDKSEIKGSVKFIATNDVGPKWDYYFYNVSFKPTGSINPISDEWNNMEVTADVLASEADDETNGKFGYAQLSNLVVAS